jgi:hypothetical protein
MVPLKFDLDGCAPAWQLPPAEAEAVDCAAAVAPIAGSRTMTPAMARNAGRDIAWVTSVGENNREPFRNENENEFQYHFYNTMSHSSVTGITFWCEF